MLSRIRSKLNSRSGVSLVLALFLLLICAFAGAAALTAASSNIGRYDYVSDYQQQYLAVSSAAGLIKDELVGFTYNSSGSNFYDDEGLIGLIGEELAEKCIEKDKAEIKLELTVEDDENNDMAVTVIIRLSGKNTNEIEVIVQSKEYALGFSLTMGNADKESGIYTVASVSEIKQGGAS